MKINFIPSVPLASTWVPLNATPGKNPLYYNCLYLLSPRITIDASYIKQKTMEENQNEEEEVLLVADKDDDGKLKAVDK